MHSAWAEWAVQVASRWVEMLRKASGSHSFQEKAPGGRAGDVSFAPGIGAVVVVRQAGAVVDQKSLKRLLTTIDFISPFTSFLSRSFPFPIHGSHEPKTPEQCPKIDASG